jgi:hypothetical protein
LVKIYLTFNVPFAVAIYKRLWSYGPREIFGVIVAIQNLGSSSASFSQRKMWKMLKIHIITTSKVYTALVIGPILIQMLRHKKR